MTKTEIEKASHASMCKKCPSARVDGRILGFDKIKGCVIVWAVLYGGVDLDDDVITPRDHLNPTVTVMSL